MERLSRLPALGHLLDKACLSPRTLFNISINCSCKVCIECHFHICVVLVVYSFNPKRQKWTNILCMLPTKPNILVQLICGVYYTDRAQMMLTRAVCT